MNLKRNGETTVIIKELIKHYELDKHPQATSFRINDGSNNLTIYAVYCLPRHKVDDKKFIEFIQTLGTRFIAGGDYTKHTFRRSRLIITEECDLFKFTKKIKAQSILLFEINNK